MTGGDAYQDMTVDTGKATKPSLGFWLETESGVACEIAAEVGYGVVILDMEHGRLSRDGAARLIRLAQDRGLTVYSRVAAPEAVSVQDALEAGAYGVIIPQLRDLGHAREVAAFAKYPPLGSRAIGRSGRPSDLTDGEDRRTRYFPMIETAGALEDASRIAALDTVMACFSVRPNRSSVGRTLEAIRPVRGTEAFDLHPGILESPGWGGVVQHGHSRAHDVGALRAQHRHSRWIRDGGIAGSRF